MAGIREEGKTAGQSDGVSDAYKEANGFVPGKVADLMIGFYDQIDALCAQVESRLTAQGIPKKCAAGCCACCIDGLTMTQAEAAVIEKLFPRIGREKPHAEGACAFLDAHGLCRIYEARPIKCRTFGLPHRMVEETADGAVEERNICELRENDVDVLALDPGSMVSPVIMDMKLGAIEQLTYGKLRRVAYRSFFPN